MITLLIGGILCQNIHPGQRLQHLLQLKTGGRKGVDDVGKGAVVFDDTVHDPGGGPNTGNAVIAQIIVVDGSVLILGPARTLPQGRRKGMLLGEEKDSTVGQQPVDLSEQLVKILHIMYSEGTEHHVLYQY